MNDTQKPFMDYWLEVDAALLEFFGIDSSSAGIDEKEIAMAQETGCSPEEFAHWHGDRYDLAYLDHWKAIYRLGHQGTTARKIAAFNDLCRKAMGITGRLVQTAGICALPSAQQSAIREKVETFKDFSPDNDPHGERDFGAFEHEGERIFWKIDYYDTALTKGSEDPTDPKQTVRVLTIMLASEY